MTWMDIQYLNCWRSFYQLFLFIVPFSRAASHVNENGDLIIVFFSGSIWTTGLYQNVRRI